MKTRASTTVCSCSARVAPKRPSGRWRRFEAPSGRRPRQLEFGCVQLALDRLTEAAAHLERALALDPRGARAHLLLGKVYLRQGKTQAAEEHLRLGSQTAK